MASNKRLAIAIILMAAIIIFVFTVALDLSRYFGFYDFYSAYPNDLLKRINVLLAAALVWTAGKGSLNHKDNRLMKLVFIVICIGEVFFLLAKPAIAIGVFAVCQALLIFRHSKGLTLKLVKAGIRQKVPLLLWAAVLALAIITTFIQLYPVQEYRALAVIAVSYWSILSLSVWTAQANYILGIFPKPNAKMAAVGMVCFYFCDICVGLDGILSGSTIWMLANSLIWIFYTPAITLLALSCYKYEASPRHINRTSLGKTRALK